MNRTLTTITLALVLTFGATIANAGIIVGDKAQGSCGKNGIIVGDAPIGGIIVGDLVAPGIIISDLVSGIAGIIVSDRKGGSTPCKNGIIVGDSPTSGIIVSDSDAPTGGI